MGTDDYCQECRNPMATMTLSQGWQNRVAYSVLAIWDQSGH